MARVRTRKGKEEPGQPVSNGFDDVAPGDTPLTAEGVTSGGSELAAVLADINEKKGANTVRYASAMPGANHIPTGCFILDCALLGGIPDGFNTMLYGYESSGKTTMAKKIVAGFQRKYLDKSVAWLDLEGLMDALWAKQLGCDTSRIVAPYVTSGEEAVDMVEALMEPWEIGMLVLDSIPSCVPMAVLDKSAYEKNMAVLAQLMSVMCSKIIMAQARERKRGHRVSVILLNQFRSKVGLVFGDPRTLPGGRQINHIPSTKIELKNKEKIGEDQHGHAIVDVNEHSFDLTKHKHGASMMSGDFRMVINPNNDLGLKQGEFDDMPTVATFGKSMNVITGSPQGGWTIDGVSGKLKNLNEIRQFWTANPDQYLLIKQQLIAMKREQTGLPAIPPDKYLLDWCQ